MQLNELIRLNFVHSCFKMGVEEVWRAVVWETDVEKIRSGLKRKRITFIFRLKRHATLSPLDLESAGTNWMPG